MAATLANLTADPGHTLAAMARRGETRDALGMRKTGLVVALAAVIANNGCSWTLMDRVPSGYKPTETPYCSAGYGAVAVDVIIAALNTVAFAAILNDSTLTDDEKAGPAIGTALEGIMFAASADSGTDWAKECRKARQAHEEQLHAPTDTGSAASSAAKPLRYCNRVNSYNRCFDSLELCEEVLVKASKDGANVQSGCKPR